MKLAIVARSATMALALIHPMRAADLMLGDRTFSFPDEFALEIGAAPPLVDRPVEADFDPQGRLYVTESSGSNEPVEEQLKTKPHRLLRLTDTDGDGRFDARTVFADGLMLPEGCLWHEGSVLVCAPPHIWKFTDVDDDGVADRREVWFDGKTLTGCANDLHGPYRGPDGWIYWCKGAFAEQTYDLPGRSGWKSRAAHVFRARYTSSGPEGIEPVFTAGMDNPVGLAWTPEADLIVSGTFFQHPGGGQRDGLIHAVRGGVWGKDHDVLDPHPRTGALMPPMTHLGPAAPAGLVRYGSDLLCAQFNMRKVSRHVLRPAGATWKTSDSDFLLCDHPDFHPTDVLQAPDGSVLVIDTGGWYKLCCPTSQVAKPQALGAIYRLRKKGGETPTDIPRPAFPTLGASGPQELTSLLKAENLHTRRRAAERLAEGRDSSAIASLFEALAAPDVDRFLFHAFTRALMEIGAPMPTRAGFHHAHPAVQAATLYALEQMPGGGLRFDEVLPHLAANDDQVREAALFVTRRHREWAPSILPWVRANLADPSTAGESIRPLLLAHRDEAAIRDFLGDELAATLAPTARRRLLECMAAGRTDSLPEAWLPGLTSSLMHEQTDVQRAAVKVISRLRPEDRLSFSEPLRALALAKNGDPVVRLEAIAALQDHPVEAGAFDFMLASLQQPAVAGSAAAACAARRLSVDQLNQLADSLSEAGWLERPLLLRCFAGQADEALGLRLVAALDHSKLLATTSSDTLQEIFANFPAAVQSALAKACVTSRSAHDLSRLETLESSLPAGDAERGLIVFQSAQAACATCHPLGYKGGTLGPDLSKVGAIRTRRDLLEALVFPSASFVRSYEPVQVVKHDGVTIYGIISNQGESSVTIATGAVTPSATLSRSEIKSMTPGTLSLMPQGIDQILSAQQLADVIAYLLSRR